MKLAKPRIDIGFATNDAPAALAFWQNEIATSMYNSATAEAASPPLFSMADALRRRAG